MLTVDDFFIQILASSILRGDEKPEINFVKATLAFL